jgi:CxxC motif-containing protein (DUF1111 family)
VSCVACHHAPETGGSSQVRAVRAGYFDGVNFIEPAGGSLIAARALDRSIRPRIPADANVKALRTSLSTLGLGYVEAVADSTLLQIAQRQTAATGGQIKGQAILVDLLEAPGQQAIGRFGWKDQHASLLSFAADAYRNEMGVTTPLFPTELTANGRSVDAFQKAGTPNEPTNDELNELTDFMRATKAPPRSFERNNRTSVSSRTLDQGQKAFNDSGCAICHVPTLTTAPTGTVINGGTYTIPAALGNITFHPYSDFLLHDVGTGDGIVQNGGQATRNKLRTTPLWGLSKRLAYLHDGSVNSLEAAISQHGGEATTVISNYTRLSPTDRQALVAFLRSL